MVFQSSEDFLTCSENVLGFFMGFLGGVGSNSLVIQQGKLVNFPWLWLSTFSVGV